MTHSLQNTSCPAQSSNTCEMAVLSLQIRNDGQKVIGIAQTKVASEHRGKHDLDADTPEIKSSLSHPATVI